LLCFDIITFLFYSYGNRTFAVTGPRLSNSLLVQLRNPGIPRTVQTTAERTPFFRKH